MFFEPFPEGSSQFPNVLLTICLGAFLPVDYSSLLNSGALSLGVTNRLHMVKLPLK